MPTLRFNALKTALSRNPVLTKAPSDKLSDFYNSNVFNDSAMKNFLSKEAYEAVSRAVKMGEKIDRSHADAVASGMKNWAMSRGVTHYTHWFQPLTGATAEKHDAFFEPTEDGRSMEKFSGGALVQQEPDASSFPNGGIRNTFEARGYTAWDPSSPAFIMEENNGKTLCIPTIFVSYTGEALDFKAPLLKALHAVEKSVVSVCADYFDKNVTKSSVSLGIEQEYFLIDEAMFYARPDLMLTGRTLLGHAPEKGQQLEDHYFGSIPPRIHDFMVDYETEAYKLGIPLKTRHNEVAPGQFECAPNFEEANLAVDHNQLLMDLMEKVSQRHGLKVLLHEKPFAGVNGSGKHNNWSLITNTGVNLLAPTKNPETNLQFLTFFVNVIKAVSDNADLLRASIATASNDHRLGANEAPPAIMSIFIGSQMTNVLDSILNDKSNAKVNTKSNQAINVIKIPDILLDNTDRNRTSPFAFTGNKFEFRAVGSSANCANAMIVLNTVMADQLTKFKAEVDALIKKGKKKEEAILTTLKAYYKASKNILFEGNGYSDEWVKEAAKRGLSNVKTTPEALNAYVSKQSADLFTRNNIFSKIELEARYEIMQELYVKKIDIEAKTLSQLATSHVIPAAVEYQSKLAINVQALKGAGLSKASYETQLKTIETISKHIKTISDNVEKMIIETDKAHHAANTHKAAIAFCHKVKPLFDHVRGASDALEFIVDDTLWQLPKYREMLFIK